MSQPYDAEAAGAMCSVCPLKAHRIGGPVAPDLKVGAQFAIVGDFPVYDDVRVNRPLASAGGMALNEALDKVGLSRSMASVHLAIACQPPGNDLKMVRAKGRKLKMLDPVTCCAPRLKAELEGQKKVITLGDSATKSVTGTAMGILSVRGGPRTMANGTMVLPTVSPGMAIKARKWLPVLAKDLGRAARWFMRGNLDWADPAIYLFPNVDEVAAFLAKDAAFWAYDVETDGIEAMTANLRCVGISTKDAAIVVPILGMDGTTRWYSEGDLARVKQLLARAFTDGRQWVGHNAGYYDRMVMENHLKVTPAPLMDTILLHRLAEPGLPHDLGFVGSTWSDVHSWKADNEGRKLANAARSDRELHHYCALDCVVTARVAPLLAKAVVARGQAEPLPASPEQTLLDLDHWAQGMCVNLHRVGMYVNQEWRERAEDWLTHESEFLRVQCAVAGEDFGMKGFNPNSGPQMRDLLFNKWKLVPEEFTETGDPSVNDEALRGFISMRSLTKEQRAYLMLVRRFRKVRNKWLGTYVSPLKPKRFEGKAWDRDGRVRASWNAHGTLVGRLSCSDPNLQTIPSMFRYLFQGAPGHELAGADADQIHLRIIAARWGVARLQEVFLKGGDPHAAAAEVIFGERFTKSEGQAHQNGGKWSGQAKSMRQIAKTFQYAAAYGAEPSTIQNVLTKAEDERGNLINLALTVRQVTAMREKWLAGMPEFEKGWNMELAIVESNARKGKVDPWGSDPVAGRRRDYPNGVEDERNEITNAPIIMTESAIMHLAVQDLLTEIPWDKWGPGTGIIAQVHDSITVEVPRGMGKWASEVVAASLTRRIPGLDVPFTATGTFGDTWVDA
jgi:uracil-DNA glycosylase family 4